jgi:alkaline phosphatase D
VQTQVPYTLADGKAILTFKIQKDIPPLIFTLFAIYLPSFIANFLSQSPFKILLDEVDITVTAKERPSQPSPTLSDGNLPPVNEDVDIDIIDVVLLIQRGKNAFKTLLTGLPSPISPLLSIITAAFNLGLVLMTVDLVFRGPVWYPSHDLSFARVGYVSDNSAKILVREWNTSKLPIYLSYRVADSPSHADLMPHQKFISSDASWQSARGIYFLSNQTDYTSAATISGLAPETRYQYATSSDHTGFFTTAPSPGSPTRRNRGRFTFLTSSCIKPHFPYNVFSHPLTIPGLKNLAQKIPELKAQFILFLGDFIYIDAPWRHGNDVESYRREYRMVYSSPDWPSVSENLPWIHVLDDHEIANDWDRNTTGVYKAAADPWQHYHTSVNPPEVRKGASYFSFNQGPASFFMMDTRRYRSSETAAAANSTEKTMLGEQQLADLLSWLRRDEPRGVKWKIIASSIPFTKNWRFGGLDTWGGYLAERQKILEVMWDVGLRGFGVVVLSGDRHEFAATSFPPPAGGRWPISTTVHEFSTSPLSQFYLPVRTYRQEDGEDVLIKYVFLYFPHPPNLRINRIYCWHK